MNDVRSQSGNMRAQGLTILRAADWHGLQAAKAYRRRQWDAYKRHARIADQLWSSK